MRTLLVRTKRFANRHSENLTMSLADILPDGKCRKQAIDGMRKFVQKPGENWPVSGNVTKNVLVAIRLV